jgi:hypothetical protein
MSVLTQEQVDELFDTWTREDDERIIRALQRRISWIGSAPAVTLPEQLRRYSYSLKDCSPTSPRCG